KTHVAGQLQGYMLQVRHMLFELISLDDIIVSIEKIDDVAVESPDGSVVAEQVKSVTSDNNPIANRSAVFWKTLYNWLSYIKDGSLKVEKTSFHMVVSSSHTVSAGDMIEQFHKASTIKDAKKALSAAKLELWGKDEISKKDVPCSYGKYLEVLFLDDNEILIAQIIEKFALSIHQNNYDDKLIKKFNAHVLLSEFEENLLIYMLGWVNDQVNEYTKKGLPATISSIDYRNALTIQKRMYDQRNSIPALSREIASDEAHTEVENQDIYIRQLDLIELDYGDKLEAASDYLRTKAEATIRADKGLFTPQSLTDYNDKIRRLWKSKQTQSLLLAVDSDVSKGKYLYAQTNEAVIPITLAENVLPSFFGSGTLQTLANEPHNNPVIGWHPNYCEILNKDGEHSE
ncbi:MAG: hypothetical protein FWE43_03975, partial [Streptococcaceae bacterium]|nr:hypothetical protein [Streptococcaceae bacterium]